MSTEATAPLFAQHMGRAVAVLRDERGRRLAKLAGHDALTPMTKAQQRIQQEVYALAEAIAVLEHLEMQANASKGPASA